jgi:hypothetical protein
MTDDRKLPLIGAFVLETLTLGMYGEPRHTLREYIQNSFDSIRAAQRTKVVSDRGRVDITVEADVITIRDNGGGVPAAQAWITLTSIGASKKDRRRDAGFRGIGRFAGMAYCDKLTFRTTFIDETVTTTITFDCMTLRAAMSPDKGGDIELAKLLNDCVTMVQEEATPPADHFFEVILSGLSEAPETLTNPSEISDYLAATAPVDFDPSWSHRDDIAASYRDYFGEPIETIDVFVTADNEEQPIYKAYGEYYQQRKGAAQIAKIDFIDDEDGRYWGWVGHLNKSGAVTDVQTRGLRIRVRNIQVGTTEIFDRLFGEFKPSYARFSRFYVGEFHMNPTKVVPNARRDGFEETPEWIGIQEELTNTVCKDLAKAAYDASRAKKKDIENIITEIESLEVRSGKLISSAAATYDQVVELMHTAKRLRQSVFSALKSVEEIDETSLDDEPEVLDAESPEAAGRELVAERAQEAARSVESIETQALELMGYLVTDNMGIDALRLRIRQEAIQEILDVVNLFVDAGTYQRIKRQLEKRNKPSAHVGRRQIKLDMEDI